MGSNCGLDESPAQAKFFLKLYVAVQHFAGSVIFGPNKLRLMTRLQKNVSVFQGGSNDPPCPCLWAPMSRAIPVGKC